MIRYLFPSIQALKAATTCPSVSATRKLDIDSSQPSTSSDSISAIYFLVSFSDKPNIVDHDKISVPAFSASIIVSTKNGISLTIAGLIMVRQFSVK